MQTFRLEEVITFDRFHKRAGNASPQQRECGAHLLKRRIAGRIHEVAVDVVNQWPVRFRFGFHLRKPEGDVGIERAMCLYLCAHLFC